MNNPSHELLRIAIAYAGNKVKTPKGREFILTFLAYHDFITPTFGTVKKLVGCHKMNDYCIVYLPGQPSQRMPLVQAFDQHSNEFAVMFQHDKRVFESPYKRTRLYQIGSSRFWVNMSSHNWRMTDSRMNVDKVQHNTWDHKIAMPYFSIDFARSGKLHAVDFDIRTGIRGTGIERILGRKQITDLLKSANKKFNWPPEPIT